MTVIAAGILFNAFATEQLHVRVVATYSALGLAPLHRLMAAWGSPSGVALGAAAATGLAALVTARGRSDAARVSSSAAFMCTLLSIVVVRNPLATLGFVPADGLGASLALQHPVWLLNVAGLLTMAATAPRALAIAVTPATIERNAGRWALLTMVAGSACLISWWYAGVAAGVTRIASPLAVQGGAGALLLIALAAGTRVLHKRLIHGTAAVTAGLGVAVTCVAILLAAPAPVATPPQRAVQFLAVTAVILAVWAVLTVRRETHGAGDTFQVFWSTSSLYTPAGVLLFLSLSCAVTALVGSALSRESRGSIASGDQYRSPFTGDPIVHLGLSRFEISGGQIVALALDHGGTLRQAQKREVVNVRGEPLAPVATPPAVFREGFSAIAVWMEDVLPGDAAQITVRKMPLAWLWPLAAALLVAACLVQFIMEETPR